MRSWSEMAQQAFLIVSNMRCGSTLTQFMLGELSDVSTDYELKWKPGYAPHPIHLVLDEHTGSLKSKLFASVTGNRIVGSKLVFDPVPHSTADYQAILSLIDADMQIIHIKRPYWQVVASSLRGFIHMPTQQADGSDSAAYRILLGNKEQSAAKAVYTLRRSEVRISDVWRLLKILLANDLCALALRRRNPYMRVCYGNLAAQLPAMAHHIGSRETPEKIHAIAQSPPLEKLPPLRYEGNFTSLKILAWLFDAAFRLAVLIR